MMFGQLNYVVWCREKYRLTGFDGAVNNIPIERENIRLTCKPGHDFAAGSFHVDMRVVVNFRPLFKDTEQRRAAHVEGAARDKENEHGLAIPSGTGQAFAFFDEF